MLEGYTLSLCVKQGHVLPCGSAPRVRLRAGCVLNALCRFRRELTEDAVHFFHDPCAVACLPRHMDVTVADFTLHLASVRPLPHINSGQLNDDVGNSGLVAVLPLTTIKVSRLQQYCGPRIDPIPSKAISRPPTVPVHVSVLQSVLEWGLGLIKEATASWFPQAAGRRRTIYPLERAEGSSKTGVAYPRTLDI